MSGVEVRPVDVALRDGSTVRVRAVRPEDVEGLRALLGGMSDRSRWLRFLSAAADVEQAARSAARPEGGVGLVATAGSPERIVAHATYMRETPERAEVAFEVADAWHGRGLATILLAHLAGEAERDGVATFVAYVHPTNHRMIGVFRDSGFPVEVRATIDELVVEMPASLADDARERFEDRARLAAVAAVAHVLRPASVAVASPDVLDHAVAYGYRGAKLEAGPVELAVLDGSPEQVLDSARAWGASGARALAVLASGFADAGPAGRERLAELLAVCRRTGMRLIGPNSVGVLNTDPELRLNATRARQPPPAGHVALASQSGALGMAAMAEAARRGLGISSFASTGDKADLSGNDFLQYWQQDAATEVILLYLESFGNPRRFARIARDVALQKPIVAIKSGRDPTVDALFAHAGVIRTDTLADQLDVAALLACQPLPDSDRVAVVSNARGPALACADACTAAGLRVVSSVDLGAGAVSDDYANALDRFRANAVVAIVAPGFAAEPAEVAGVLRGAAGPLLGVFMGQGDPQLAALGSGVLPAYRSPEEAARALGRAAWYAGWRRRPPDPPPVLAGVDADAAAAILASALARGDGWLHAPEVEALLGAYGIRTTAAAAREPEGHVAQRTAPDGVEMVAGVVADPDFGPVVTCGPGGPTAELFGDAAVGLAPLGRRSAAAMVRSLRAFPLLDGYRGRPVADVGAFEDVLVRLAALAAAHGEVAEIDCDPVLAGSGGAVIIDARVRVQPAAAARPFPALDR